MWQYLEYLKGLRCEVEVGDFYSAKKHYIDSLTKSAYVNHGIRKKSLERLMSINSRIKHNDCPERVLLSKYYIKEKHVQVIIDTTSFQHTKNLRTLLDLPTKIYNKLEADDHFGLKQLKNGFDPQHLAHQQRLKIDLKLEGNCTHPCDWFCQDIIPLESKTANQTIKEKRLKEFADKLNAHWGTKINKNKIMG